MKYERLFNFSAGPANLPESVLEQVRDEMMNYKRSGMSVMEMSHRSKEFDEILANATARTKELMGLGDDYEVLFLQGGASLQFAMIPMNLCQPGKPVDVMHTGYWSEMAIKELKKGFESRLVYDGTKDKFTKIADVPASEFNPEASYAYLCSNNTIEGSQFKKFPKTGSVPLIADMSSDILSRKIDFKQFGMIFAGAQKNLGPSGVTMVVMRKDLAERGSDKLPTMLQYRTHTKGGSRYNTPPAFGIYICGLVLDWIAKQGGLDKMEQHNAKKAGHIYDAIDGSGGFYHCPVDKAVRSDMNVVWRIKPGTPDSEKLEESFIKEAKAAGLLELKGHRAVGGIRASIYNAHPIESTQRLAEVMKNFQKKNG
jgi:phosphoserine aminotransferase